MKIRKKKILLFVFFSLTLFSRIYIFEFFYVPSNSMEKTLQSGDVIFVTKIEYSLLNVIFKSISYYKEKRLVELGDLVVFKSLKGNKKLVKRCSGLPTDTIQIINNELIINNRKIKLLNKTNYNCDDTQSINLNINPTDMNIRLINEDYFMFLKMPESSKYFSQSEFFAQDRNDNNNLENFITLIPVYPQTYQNGWSIKNYGPMTLLDKNYFFLGDNNNSSIDSRHFGPIPEENIIGKVVFVLFNYQNGKFRWDRFLKRIE